MGDKYDRQLRLWGGAGQKRLAEAHVLILGSNALAAEVAKNLILPGLGTCSLMDDALVSVVDLGVNFLIEPSDIGFSRAERVLANALKLNPDTRGRTYNESVQTFLKSPREDVLSHTDLVIVTYFSTLEDAALLCSLCSRMGIHFLYAQCTSLMGSVRVFSKEYTAVHSKTSRRAFQNLRIADAFPSLQSYCLARASLRSLSDQDHAGTPFPVLLIVAILAFQRCHDGQSPAVTDREWIEEWLRSESRTPSEPNFQEALKFSRLACEFEKTPPNVQEILNFGCASKSLPALAKQLISRLHREGRHATTQLIFDIAFHALQRFLDTRGRHPTTAQLPDMASTTRDFIALQRLYRAEAEADYAVLQGFAMDILASIIKLSLELPEEELPCTVRPLWERSKKDPSPDMAGVIGDWCQRIGFTDSFLWDFYHDYGHSQLCCYRTLEEELASPLPVAMDALVTNDPLDEELSCVLATGNPASTLLPVTSPLNAYVIHTALGLKHNRGPPTFSPSVTVPDSNVCISKALQRIGLPPTVTLHPGFYDDRWLAACHREVHVSAAFIGGVAAQEASKLLTRRFVPLNNTFLWNGYSAKALTLEF